MVRDSRLAFAIAIYDVTGAERVILCSDELKDFHTDRVAECLSTPSRSNDVGGLGGCWLDD